MATIKTKAQPKKPSKETAKKMLKTRQTSKEVIIKDKEIVNSIKNEIFESTKATLPELLKNKVERIIDEIAIIQEEYKTDDDHLRGTGLLEAQIAPIIAQRSVNFYVSATYTSDELYIIFEEFSRMIAQINKKMKYLPTKKKFCMFAGISSSLYNSYLQDFDENKRGIMQMIDDYITDVNLSSAQQGDIREITTMFRSKAEHGMIEAQAPTVIEHKTVVDYDEIKDKLSKFKKTFIELDK